MEKQKAIRKQQKRQENPKHIEQFGNANNKNNLMIIIPCHRVIGKRGDITGYAGGIKIKEKLIELEKKNNNKIQGNSDIV